VFLGQIGSLHFVIALVSGWLQREQGTVLEYLKEENRVLREHLGDKRLRFTDAQRSWCEPVRLPARSPNLNAYAERFVLSIKSECLDKAHLAGRSALKVGGSRIRSALQPTEASSGPWRRICGASCERKPGRVFVHDGDHYILVPFYTIVLGGQVTVGRTGTDSLLYGQDGLSCDPFVGRGQEKCEGPIQRSQPER